MSPGKSTAFASTRGGLSLRRLGGRCRSRRRCRNGSLLDGRKLQMLLESDDLAHRLRTRGWLRLRDAERRHRDGSSCKC